MESALLLHRLQFAFTASYHYVFPQVTMGLALIIFAFRLHQLKTGDAHTHMSADFWTKFFALYFAFGVVTGIPLEFQFGTNWSAFSQATGGVIGQTLGMEGMFSFFLESTLLGVLIYGRNRLSKRGLAAVSGLLFFGTWLSGYFIIVTNAWMQHPVGHAVTGDGGVQLVDLSAMLLNPWAWWQYAHNMCGSVVTGAFCVAATGAYYALSDLHQPYGRIFIRWGVITGLIASTLQIFPTGDAQGAMVARHQPLTLAAMEGHFHTREGAGIALVGQPNMERLELDNPIMVPKALSFLTHKRWNAEVKGLSDFPRDQWPDNIPLLYYSYHIMVGLGTGFITLMALSAFALYRRTLMRNRTLLWLLMLAFPFPFIANTAGWMTAELGRQPWLVYGLMRTADGASHNVSAGNGLFTLLGFAGLYALMTLLAAFLTLKIIRTGPREQS